MKTRVKIFTQFNHDHGLPSYSTIQSSGMDVRSNEAITVYPGQTVVVKTGIFVQIPDDYEIQIRPRSGLSLKTNLRVSNAPGTIDADYRGEIGVIMENRGESEVNIPLGERVAQLVLQEVPKIQWESVSSIEDLTDTARGAGGYGSTGTR